MHKIRSPLDIGDPDLLVKYEAPINRIKISCNLISKISRPDKVRI